MAPSNDTEAFQLFPQPLLMKHGAKNAQKQIKETKRESTKLASSGGPAEPDRLEKTPITKLQTDHA
jgi:hypothetical protein